ncbi:MAG: hypothetical protein LAN63_16725 [Acidobacteriia bacterium]|nr:hypothetical protein [Terriglobia bacterium]
MEYSQVKNETANALVERADVGSPETCLMDQLPPHVERSWLDGRPVVRSPEQLRMHPVLDELDLIDVVGELNEVARLKHQSVPEPILITTNGTILNGFGR